MNIKKTDQIIILLLGCLLLHASLFAQPSFRAKDIISEVRTTFEVPISVEDFTDITNVELSINWEADLLEFKSVQISDELIHQGTTPMLNFAGVNSGYLTLDWEGTQEGLTLEDNTIVLTLFFTTYQKRSLQTEISITDNPLPIRITKNRGNSNIGIYEISNALVQLNGLSCRAIDSLSLIDLWGFTQGPDWTNNWDIQQPIDTWYGVTLNETGCLEHLHLSNDPINGPGNNIRGSIPKTFGDMTSLQSIHITHNPFLISAIPDEIETLTQLQTIYLNDNALFDTIPSSIGQFADLTIIHLQNNDLNGPIPSSFGQLNDLKRLDLSNNQLDNVPPQSLGNLSKLEYFDISSNYIEGAIPSTWNAIGSASNTPLELFGLADNQLEDLPDLTNINAQVFTVQDNRLTFEDIVPNVEVLTEYAPQATVGEEYIENLVAGSSFTIKLDVDNELTTNSYRWFRNNIPVGVTTVNQFEIASIRESDEGTYTCTITNPNAPDLTLKSWPIHLIVHPDCRENDSLQLVMLYEALGGENWTNAWDLTQPFETWYGIESNSFHCVTSIDLSDNQLIGAFPNLELSELANLNLSDNQISGQLPDFQFMPKLTKIWLNNNQLVGEVPDLNHLRLVTFQINNNQITNLLGLTNIFSWSIFPDLGLHVRHNQLSFDDIIPNRFILGTFDYVPQDSIVLNRLIKVPLGSEVTINLGIDEALTDNTYRWFKDEIEFQETSSNQLTISNIDYDDEGWYYAKITNEQIDDLELVTVKVQLIVEAACVSRDSIALINFYHQTNGNNWTTQWDTMLPYSIWPGVFVNDLGCVRALDLPNNNIVGTLDNGLADLTDLVLLNLAENQLSGGIPTEFGELSNLQELQLYQNQLTGIIPSSLGALSALEVLNLHDNQLDSFPNLSQTWTANNWVSIELQNNQFTFDDLLPNIDFIRTQNYTPQDTIFKDTTIYVDIGDAVAISLGIDENIDKNIYEWIKDGADLYQENIGDNQLLIDNFQLADIGEYVCRITNIEVPSLILISYTITLQTNCAPIEVEEVVALCEGDIYEKEGQTLTESGTYSFDYTSVSGCDSIQIIQLNINKIPTRRDSFFLCEGDIYRKDNLLIERDTFLNYTKNNLQGCDSVITEWIFFEPTYRRTFDINLCKSTTFDYAGKTYTETGVYEVVLPSEPCDSIITLNLHFQEQVEYFIDTMLCTGEEYILGTDTLKTGGQYFQSFITNDGCDSVVVVTIEFNETPETFVDTTICVGESFQIGDNNYTQEGGYRVKLASTNGCDSIVQLNLELKTFETYLLQDTICAGDTYTFDGQTLTDAGNYEAYYTLANTCDSLVELTLIQEEMPPAEAGVDVSTCNNFTELLVEEPPFVDGTWYSLGTATITEQMNGYAQINNLQAGNNAFVWSLSTTYCGTYSEDTILVSLPNTPIANDDQLFINNLVPVTINVLENDTFNAPYQLTLLEEAEYGRVLYNNNQFTYIPNRLEEDSFSYEICLADCLSLCSQANVLISSTLNVSDTPDAITPNDDGQNDTWIIPVIEQNPTSYPDRQLIIYNRWGDVVYEQQPYNNDWNGINNTGTPLPQATYYYILHLNLAEGITQTGHITILR